MEAQTETTEELITVNPWARLGAYLLEGLLAAVTLWIGWIIWALTLSGKGQTPAKKLLNHTVVDINTGQPLGLGRMFWVRGLVAGLVASIAIPLSLFILLFMPLWDSNNQNIWDKVSGSYVIPTP
ncbi:MAG: RDD family protein, partial [Actinomycetota bacterium]|nr:RDD family protein [Actinomycetota bacterium]